MLPSMYFNLMTAGAPWGFLMGILGHSGGDIGSRVPPPCRLRTFIVLRPTSGNYETKTYTIEAPVSVL